jgi:Ca-activated chloride channel family protein
MNKVRYTYPIAKILRWQILVEFMTLLVVLVGVVLMKWVDFKKEWVKEFIPASFEENAKQWAKERWSNDTVVTFLHFENAWFFLFIPLFIVVEVVFMRWRNQKVTNLDPRFEKAKLFQPLAVKRFFWRYFWLRSAIVCFIVASMQPVMGTQKIASKAKNAELIIALDISNSMNVKDINAEDSRLTISKRAVIQLINTLQGERLGICIFAGTSFVQLPLTNDYDAAKMLVNEIESDMISKQGTNLQAALQTSQRMFSKVLNQKSLVVVTDGENLEGNPLNELAKLKQSKIQFAVIGVGTKKGGHVPNDPTKKELGYKVDQQGKRIVSKVNPAFIKQIAQEANGYAILAANSFPNLEECYQLIHKQSTEATANNPSEKIDVKENSYRIPLLLGLLLLLVYCFQPTIRLSKMKN